MYQVQLVREQQESRPLLSPSIDDFLSESRSEAASSRAVASSTAVLSTALDLVDLSEPGQSSGSSRSPLRRKSPRRRARPDKTELIQVEVEPRRASPRTPERTSLDSVSLPSPLDVNDGRCRRRYEKRCTSQHSSSELLWSAEFKTDSLTKNAFGIHSFDDLDFISSTQDCAGPRRRRRTRSLLARNESLEDEFVRAKAAVEAAPSKAAVTAELLRFRLHFLIQQNFRNLTQHQLGL